MRGVLCSQSNSVTGKVTCPQGAAEDSWVLLSEETDAQNKPNKNIQLEHQSIYLSPEEVPHLQQHFKTITEMV